jgi:ABC-2 type transport system ATP-binding protein
MRRIGASLEDVFLKLTTEEKTLSQFVETKDLAETSGDNT